ncbi:DUF4810 domain-containing protein [Colwellia sp. 39_35_sub15_T18]|nr:DUF4810 domain-containing protein [Colwellia sp. 39_35_sub15_T18]
MKAVFIVVFIAIFLAGCQTTKPMYEYEDYAESFYSLKKEGGEETAVQWKTSLESIVEKSKAKAVRVPPGVYANLGYIHLKVNNNEGAITFFEQEKAIYPEATKFMDNLIKKAKAKG